MTGMTEAQAEQIIQKLTSIDKKLDSVIGHTGTSEDYLKFIQEDIKEALDK